MVKAEQIAVSVVVPIYNVEDYLEECLDSLERQTLKNIEVIMVNDGSVDRSGDIAEKYVKKNENFILINRENGGLSAARNTGIEQASGKYIYFLDSDDYLVDNALEVLFMKAEKESLDVIKFAAYTFIGHSREFSWDIKDGYRYKGEYPDIYAGIDALQIFVDNKDASFPSCCFIFTKLSVIKENKLRFYEGIIHEDNLFHLQLMSLSERVAILNEPLYYRRVREGSIMETPNWMYKNESMCVTAEEADRFLSFHPGLSEKTIGWYIIFFIWMIVLNWNNMEKDEQFSDKMKEIVKRIKPIAKKYHYGKNRDVYLFVSSMTLFRIYRDIVEVMKKLLGRQK